MYVLLCAFTASPLSTNFMGAIYGSDRILSTEDTAGKHEKFLASLSLHSSLENTHRKKKGRKERERGKEGGKEEEKLRI